MRQNGLHKSRNPFALVAKFRNSAGPIGGGKRLSRKRERQTEKRTIKTEVEDWAKEKMELFCFR